MTVGQLLTFGFLGVPALALVRTILAAARGKMRSSPITWAWIGIWSVAVAYGIGSAALRFAKDGKPSTLLAFGVATISVFCWLRMFRHLEAGAGQNRERVVRGTQVIAGNALQTGMYGSRAKPSDMDIDIGGVVLPYMLEAQHMLFAGTTGAGKTQAINRVLRAVRQRGQRALIADPAGGFFSRFARSGDLLFNPFDGRTVDWSPFAEIRHDYDCQRIAKAAVPDGTGEGAEWHHYAQTLLAETMLALHLNGEHSVKRLLHFVSAADTKELAALLAGTPAAILTAKGNDKMLNNTRGIIATYLGAWRYLPDAGRFSVRSWVQDEGSDGWLFVTYRDDQMGLLRGLVASILELGIVEGLSLSESTDRALWYVFDEVDSLGKVSSLRGGLTKLRKYGGRCVLGLQTVAQLRETYGRDEAQTLLANLSTKLILRAGDNETAEYFSKELGEQDVDRLQMTTGQGTSSGGLFNPSQSSQSANTSFNLQRVRQAAVMSSEILNLPDLEGFLKMPGQPVGAVTIAYERMPELQPGFLP
ncbi:TrwB protein [Xanthomonas arboricola pv. juglandis]|uniref:type IV secretion system DNA-binding domain-containing protein n=1 Tax=Xanthomonas TaxID=338 RepID=UPI000E8AA3A4|nr:type IV secretion system DNA-binding domain-containing protein [Xanthomonas sp. CPBF 426]SYZ52416.1 TrwB protein [Xanthomonas arboricola pv. juglandis]